jgi:putative MFS transporter
MGTQILGVNTEMSFRIIKFSWGFTMSRENVIYQRIERSELTKRHVGLYSAVISGHIFDGYGINMIGVTIAGMIATFHLQPHQAGLLASSVFYGMLIGTLFVGPVVDRIGRKRGLLLSIIVYSIFSLLCALATSYEQLVWFRVLQGVGLGAEVPVTLIYVSEFMPTKYRGRAVTSATFFWTSGSMAAALLGMVLVPLFGWQSMFIAGFLPALLLLPMWAMLPESIRFLVERGMLDEAENIVDKLSTVRADQILGKSGQEFAKVAVLEKKVSISQIFKGKYAKLTIGVWLMLFICGFVFYGLGAWLPSIFLKMGFGFVRSLSYSAVITGAGAVGAVMGGTLVDKIGYRRTLISFFLISGTSLMLWGMSPNTTVMVLLGVITSCLGFGAGGVIFAYASSLYPTAVRATGTGWAAFWQRCGGVVAPYVLGVIIQTDMPAYLFFVVLGIPTLLGAVIAFTMTRELTNKSLEQIHQELSV